MIDYPHDPEYLQQLEDDARIEKMRYKKLTSENTFLRERLAIALERLRLLERMVSDTLELLE